MTTLFSTSVIDLCVLWGANPEDDTPETYSFPTPAACMAFVQGINVAEGSMEANFVANANYYVNKDGELLERKGKSMPALATERFVIFGEHPEPGTRAERYAFDTVEEASAFEQGANAMAGWSKYHWVPSASHRQIVDEETLNDISVTGWLTDEGRAKLVVLAAEDELAFPVFVTPEGDWVNKGWAPALPAAPAETIPGKPRKSKM